MTETEPGGPARDFARIEAAIGYLQAHYRDQPTLEEIAAAVSDPASKGMAKGE